MSSSSPDVRLEWLAAALGVRRRRLRPTPFALSSAHPSTSLESLPRGFRRFVFATNGFRPLQLDVHRLGRTVEYTEYGNR